MCYSHRFARRWLEILMEAFWDTQKYVSRRGRKVFRGLRVNFLNNSVKFCGFCVPQQKYVSRRGCKVTQRAQRFLGGSCG